jgi:alpha-beta hydrolase superfamily lysophospholipase
VIFFKDALWDSQLLRTMGHGTYGGAEVGECLAAAASATAGDRDSWYRAWTGLGDRLYAAAEASWKQGHRVSAQSAFLRASNYYRNAYIFHLEAPLPESVVTGYRRQRDAFRRAAAAMKRPPETLAFPLGKGTMPGYFFAASAPGPRPLLIVVGGYDCTAEECYFFDAAAAVVRGYHCVVFDGPGQGGMLLEQGIPFRPDFEKAVFTVLDTVLGRADVDAKRVALLGESFGGYLAPRAAPDARVAACILDPAQLGLFTAFQRRLPLPATLKARLPDGPRWVTALLKGLLARVAKKPTAGWGLRRGVLTHGVASPWDYFLESTKYELGPLIEDIHCPTLVCDASNDTISADARAFYEKLRCEKDYLRFTAMEGSGEHCIGGDRALYHERIFDWLDTRLQPARTAPAAPAPPGGGEPTS